jgi:argininosuccinate lyase
VAGAAVKRAEGLGLGLDELPIEEFQRLEPRITADVYQVLTAKASAASRSSYGGTAPEQVQARIAQWKERLR